jgi:2-oxoglutarate ferredoxin oxidoreductase subunit gamma
MEIKDNSMKKYNGSRLEILVVGKGGEGVVLTAEILGEAATIDGKFASTRSTYGASQRGEAIFSEVIISEDPIQYNFVEAPSYFIAMSQQGFDACCDRLIEIEKPTLFIDSTFEFDLHDLDKKFDIKQITARGCALENDLKMGLANIVLLGSFIKQTKIISEESIRNALKNKFSSNQMKNNLKAFKLGFDLI